MGASELLSNMGTNIHSLSFGQKMAGAALVALLSMLIVFSVLVLLMAVIKAMEKVFQRKPDNKLDGNMETPSNQVQMPAAEVEDEELIAVISAAVAASLNTSISAIRVVNVSRSQDAIPVWAKNGLAQQIQSRL